MRYLLFFILAAMLALPAGAAPLEAAEARTPGQGCRI